MANRILRFILDNDTEGSLQVDDPLGFEEMDLVLTRDNKFFAISSELMEVELGYYGEGRDYLLNILDTQGPDNEVRVDIDISTDKGAYQELLTQGKKIQVPCLFINGQPHYESDWIINWLKGHQGQY